MKLKTLLCTGSLALTLATPSMLPLLAQQETSTAATAPSVALDQAVTMTCRQAWQAGGRNKDGFFAIVEELASLSAKNRGVTLPDNKAAGERAGNWIRTQALKDPDQLLYAVVDHAVRYSIAKGTATPTTATAQPSQ